MPYYWVKHRNGAGTIEAGDRAAAAEWAASYGLSEIVIEGTLPYPVSPVIHNPSGCPPFCFNRNNQCLNKGSCPRDYACSE